MLEVPGKHSAAIDFALQCPTASTDVKTGTLSAARDTQIRCMLKISPGGLFAFSQENAESPRTQATSHPHRRWRDLGFCS